MGSIIQSISKMSEQALGGGWEQIQTLLRECDNGYLHTLFLEEHMWKSLCGGHGYRAPQQCKLQMPIFFTLPSLFLESC